MADITLTINKKDVYDEVSKTTEYEGSKAKDDDTAYERVSVTSDDQLMLERFWLEACNMMTGLLKPFIKTVSSQDSVKSADTSKNYSATLEMSNSWDPTLKDSLQADVFSYFVVSILAKWSRMANKEDAETLTAEANGFVEAVKAKVWYRKRPTRTEPKL